MIPGKYKKVLQLVLFTGLGLIILSLLFRNLNTAYHEQCRLDGIPDEQCSLFDKLLNDFASVNPLWMLLVVLAFTASNIFRAWRWQMLLQPLGHQVRFANSLLPILLGYFVNLGFPRAGEVARAGALSRYEKIPLQKVMGTMVVDRLMDVFCLAIVVGLAFLFEADTLWEFINRHRPAGGGSNPWLLGILAVGVLGLLGLVLLRKQLMQLGLVQKLMNIIDGFWEGLRSVFRLERTGLFLLLSAGIWVMFYLQCWFNLLAFPPTAHLTAGAALMVFVFGTLGFVIPSPGGMGTFHLLAVAGLALYGIDRADAFSYAMIAFFAIQIFYNIIAGILASVLLPIINKNGQVA